MILISHRGNINGSNIELENRPEHIENAINSGFDVEIDVWSVDERLYLGHDQPQYETSVEWLTGRSKNLWLHCKNVQALSFFNQSDLGINYFWHQEDTAALTSKNFIWAYPGTQPIKSSIAVMPELHNDDTSQCIGICSDYIQKYKNENNL